MDKYVIAAISLNMRPVDGNLLNISSKASHDQMIDTKSPDHLAAQKMRVGIGGTYAMQRSSSPETNGTFAQSTLFVTYISRVTKL